jgi:hypothetical protein
MSNKLSVIPLDCLIQIEPPPPERRRTKEAAAWLRYVPNQRHLARVFNKSAWVQRVSAVARAYVSPPTGCQHPQV